MYSVNNPFYFLSMTITFTDILPWFCNSRRSSKHNRVQVSERVSYRYHSSCLTARGDTDRCRTPQYQYKFPQTYRGYSYTHHDL